MSILADLQLGEDHPLLLELASLRAAASRYQHEAHTVSLKLQRHSLDASHAIEQAHALERENIRLQEEVEVLRVHPDVTPHPAALQVPELTLALRRLSDKLTTTEDILSLRTIELAHARSALTKAQFEVEAANDSMGRAHAQEEESRARERDLERKARGFLEERKLADLVVQEYADLVRTMEGRQSKTSAPSPGRNASDSNVTLVEGLAEGKTGLQKLLEEFNAETERLASETNRLQKENEVLRGKLEAESKRSEGDGEKYAELQLQLDRYAADDKTAAKMVSRYMKFSQSTTDSLQQAMENLRTRHAATAATLNHQIESLHKALSHERRQSEKLRDTLDDLSEDFAREAYGRRREVSLRLAFLGREEGLAENLRRWIKKSREMFDRFSFEEGSATDSRGVFEKTMHDAETLLESLNGQPALEQGSPGSVARLLAAQDAVSTLTRELHEETDRRLEIQRKLAELQISIEPHAESHTGPLRVAPRLEDAPFIDMEETQPDDSGLVLSNITVEDNAAQPDTLDNDIPPRLPTTTPEQPPTVLSELGLPTQLVMDAPSSSSLSSDTPIPTDNLSSRSIRKVEEPSHSSQSTTVASVADKKNEGANAPSLASIPVISLQDALETDGSESSILVDGGPMKLDLRKDLAQSVERSHSLPTTVRQLQAPQNIVTSAETVHQPTPRSHSRTPPGILFPDTYSLQPPSDLSPVDSSATGALSSRTLATPDVLANMTWLTGSDPPAVPISPHVEVFLSSSPGIKHPLLVDLVQVKHRYDDLQKAFRDCHLALKELKKDLVSLSPSGNISAMVRTAVERLDDFNEDARVELEIRVADEERVITGYETLLSVPGAISDEVNESEMDREIRTFIDGTDKSVSRAIQQFTRKLDDLEHDIACVKRTLYESSASTDDTPPKAQPGWSSWTAGILGGSSRPASPAPTFGSVMTSPRTRLKSFSSHSSLKERDASEHDDPFSSLGLRISMPTHTIQSFTPPRGPFLPSIAPHGTRARVSSAPMYMLGLGARSTSFGPVTQSPLSPRAHLEQSHAEAERNDADLDIDIGFCTIGSTGLHRFKSLPIQQYWLHNC